MKYSQVHIESIGYELPPVVVSTAELESRLGPVYQALKMAPGQLELLTGINERRWWEPGYSLSHGAAAAAKKALAAADLTAKDIDVLIYAGVCREQFEPATACAVAHAAAASTRTRPFTTSATPASACSTASWILPIASNSARPARGWSFRPRRLARSTRTSSIRWSEPSRWNCSVNRSRRSPAARARSRCW